MQNLMSLVESLNPMQRAAVELPAEHALILAGAGSGKTRVLTTRIAWILAQGMARPSQILAVTFTNKAAKEMQDRLEAMVTADIRTMWVGTFHGIANRLLRYHAEEAGLPKTFQIMDSSDQLSLIKRLMKEAGIDTDVNDPKAFQSRINRFKEAGLRASDVAADEESGNPGFYRLYESRCQKDGLVDFAELLLRSTELLERNAILREHYAARFRFVLVDEFQDTNALQFRWIKTIASPKSPTNAVFCVGDDDQSIYAFRGARVGNMADFITDYGVKHVVKLEQNYRSTSHILDAANAVIANNENRMGKNLWTDAGAGDRITIYEAADDKDEARSLTQEVLTDHRSGRPWKDFAVLYRNNAQSRLIEQYFTANAVPYRIYGGLRFFDRAEVKDVTAYLRLLSNPEDTSLLRVINQPPRGIGLTTMERITQEAQSRGVTLWQCLTDWQQDPALVRRAGAFVSIINDMKAACEGLSLAKVVEVVLEKSGLKAFYEGKPDKDIRLENMGEVINAASGWYKENGIEEDAPALDVNEDLGMSPLDGFLSQAALEADDKNEEEVRDCVQMMTVHASKGLEFPVVFLCGLEEGLFPHAARGDEDEDKAIGEERRLMYVAMTRAREKLRISWCANRMLYGQSRDAEASRFLDEIPAEHTVTVESPKKNDRSGYGSGYGAGAGWYGNRGGRSGNAGGWQREGAGSVGFSSRTKTPGWQNGRLGKASDYLASQQQQQRSVAASSGGFSGYGFKRKEASSEPNPWGLAVGDRVTHAVFGKGTILSLKNMKHEESASARVKFDTAGEKELLLTFAKLSKI